MPIQIHDAHNEIVDFNVDLLVSLLELVDCLDLLIVLLGCEVLGGVHHLDLLGVGVDLLQEFGFHLGQGLDLVLVGS